MFIENRIRNKRNETDSCKKVNFWKKGWLEKNLLFIFIISKVFPYKRSGKTISSASDRDIRGGQRKWIKTKRSFNLQPKKQLFAKLKQKSWKIPKNYGELEKAVQAKKSVRWMPWHWEPKKDVITCDKLR